MGKRMTVVWVLVLALALALPAWGQEKATKAECEAKVKEAVQLVKDKGLDEALKAVNDKTGPFIWKDSYVFGINIDTGLTVAHIKPDFVGKNHMALKDPNGKMFFLEFVNVARDKGEGWVDYMWPKPGEKEPSKKITYVLRVPGQPILFAAGIYE